MTEIPMYKGDNNNSRWTISDSSGVAVDITTAELVFSVKKNFSDASYSFQRKNTAAGGSDAEIEILTGASGVCRVKIVPDNTSGLTVGVYQYDLETTISSSVQTVVQDNLIIKNDVT